MKSRVRRLRHLRLRSTERRRSSSLRNKPRREESAQLKRWSTLSRSLKSKPNNLSQRKRKNPLVEAGLVRFSVEAKSEAVLDRIWKDVCF